MNCRPRIPDMDSINNCTTRQLVGLPGISCALAESIIKFRDCKNGIKNMEDLLSLPGMTRSKYRMLARKYSPSSRPLVLGVTNRSTYSKITVAHTNFVCQGQSMATKLKDHGGTPRTHPGPNAAQNKVKTEHAKPRQQGQKEDYDSSSYGEKRLSSGVVALNRNAITLYPSLKPSLLQAEKVSLSRHQQLEKQSAWVSSGSAEPIVSKDAGQNMHEAANPTSVTLQTSASGNNINFSCTIDKRLLTNTAGPSTGQEPQKWTLINSEDVAAAMHQASDEPAQKKRPPSEGIGYSESTIDENICDPPININTYTSHLRGYYRAKTSSSPKTDRTSPVYVLQPLSVENMLLFDRKTRMTMHEKKSYIEAWVMDVNRAAKNEKFSRRPKNRESYDGRRQKIHPFYVEIAGRPAVNNSSKERNKTREIQPPEMYHIPHVVPETGPTKCSEPNQEFFVTIMNESQIIEDGPYRHNISPEFPIGATSDNQCKEREKKVIVEKQRILQRRAAKSGNASGRAAAKVNTTKVSRSMPEPTKHLKQLVNNYVLKNSTSRINHRPIEREFFNLTR